MSAVTLISLSSAWIFPSLALFLGFSPFYSERHQLPIIFPVQMAILEEEHCTTLLKARWRPLPCFMQLLFWGCYTVGGSTAGCVGQQYLSWHPSVWIRELPTTTLARLVLMRYGLGPHSLCLQGSSGGFPAIVLPAFLVQLLILSAFTHCSHQLLLSPESSAHRCIYPHSLLFRSAEWSCLQKKLGPSVKTLVG